MADFTSSGWSVYIMLVTAISIVACFWLTMSLSKGKTSGEEVGTTGHTWDETLAEYNNPLPRWWIYLFYITIVFAIVYLVLYPGFGASKGSFGWTQIGAGSVAARIPSHGSGSCGARHRRSPTGGLAKGMPRQTHN